MYNNPKISVLMPVYNTKEEYLREAIESILNQTYKNFELIIMDDGSDRSETKEILEYYQNYDKRINVYFENHLGIIKIRNKLIEKSNGEYCAIMDSDDISLSKRLEKEVKFLDENKDISIVGSWYECFPEYRLIKVKQNPKFLDFLKCNCFGHSTIMFRKNDFLKHDLKYNEKYDTAEDYGLWADAVVLLNCANIQESLVKYRVHKDNISHTKSEIQKYNSTEIQQNMLDFLTDDKILQQNIINLLNFPIKEQKHNYSLLQQIFSIKNEYSNNIKRKVITILGIKIKIKGR